MNYTQSHVKTTKKVIPMIYAYTTPEISSHNGWTKIGYTEKQTVEDRIKQQTHTADVVAKIEWKKTAVYDDGSGDTFTDKDFHAYLRKNKVENKLNTEWFKIDPAPARGMLLDFKDNRGILSAKNPTIPYTLRNEQAQAVKITKEFFDSHEKGEFLWNAKPRFGKTLASYDLCKELKKAKGKYACNILIVTNRPAIANSWYSDFAKFLGNASGFAFVSETAALKDKAGVLTREQYSKNPQGRSCIEFVSLQDLKGSVYFGGQYNKLEEVKNMEWELLIIDEAHEGVDTYKTDVAFDQIKRKYTLHLSGTPFKALANDKFSENAIYNWTYADEQKAKAEWDESIGTNPYANLPKLNLFTYQMSEVIRDELSRGVELDGEMEEYAFDLNEFFSVKNNKFVHDESIDKFLDSLTKFEKYPFSTDELRNELKHTLWLLNRVDSAKELAKKLENHPVFSDYKIVLAAGDGKLSEEDENIKSYDKVRKAIAENEKTITISVGQLTTGITIPEWTAVLMLSNIKSPALYMQAAFRAQNPWKYQQNGEYYVKENAYVFDFDPARTLTIFEEFANDLSSGTSGGKGDSDARKENVRELLNFFPVIGEDEAGEMIELDAEKVLTIPRKIRSLEVVKRGFMSNFLFQNISNIFNAPKEVVDIIKTLAPVTEKDGANFNITKETAENLSLNDEGEVEIPKEKIIGTANNMFGDKIYNQMSDIIETKAEDIIKNDPEKKVIDNLKKEFKKTVVDPIMKVTTENYGKDLKTSDKKALEKQLQNQTDKIVQTEVGRFNVEKNTIELQRKDALKNRFNTGKTSEEINKEFNQKLDEAKETLTKSITETVTQNLSNLGETVVKTVETKKNETEKNTIEDKLRDHLRGFARTVPSFLMAYGDENTCLENFDTIIPDEVFKEVTSITLDNFRFLRDGGDYTDAETGEKKHYAGNLFDPVVFDDSVKEFLALKVKLGNYFDESQEEDIFDYIPPQKTNQIFTPKNIVKQMVDMLEQENPNCFDDPDKTFIDLYMKSGLYITEIVKRLYNSDKIKAVYPDNKERLKHIFEKQVYGLAPTEIIYKIASNFILGFADGTNIKHNLRQFDSLPAAKNGTLEKELDKLFN